jgi:transposase
MTFSRKRVHRKVINRSSLAAFDYGGFRQKYLGAQRIISIDESSFYFNDTPRYGYSRRGTRCNVCVDVPKRRRVTLLMAVANDQVLGYQLFNGSANKERFAAFLQTLDIASGDCLIMDNVAFHKSKCVCNTVSSKGASITFIPPYSPQFNPIEMVFSKVKENFRRRYPHNDCDSSIQESINMITSNDLYAFFDHVHKEVMRIPV